MDWNTKWDWENTVSFGSKPTNCPKKSPIADWMLINDAVPFNLSRSDNSSAKSSISPSTDSSTKDFRLSSFDGKKIELSRNSPSLEASSEPLIGLKLGKRMYFENTIKAPSFSDETPKKNKMTGQNRPVCCQVEGCNTDLSRAKEYHRKHRVCDVHSKFPKVIVGGVERRFCQQCSRFHSLCEFDEKKKSCRRRLSDHNARRRKPQLDTMHFNSTRLSLFYGGTQYMLNNFPSTTTTTTTTTHSGTPSSIWDSNSKFTLTKGYPSLKSNENDGQQLYNNNTPLIKFKFPHAINGLLPTKNSTSEVFNPGSKVVSQLMSSSLYAPDRALSLLSSKSNNWDLCEPEQPINTMQSMIPESMPLSYSDFWLSGGGHQQSMHHHHPHSIQSLAANNNTGNFQEFQLFKTPYETDFYSNILNWSQH